MHVKDKRNVLYISPSYLRVNTRKSTLQELKFLFHIIFLTKLYYAEVFVKAKFNIILIKYVT